MNSKQLECFSCVAKHLNFARAAELLFITQPTVSYQISSLETELGFSLFVRDKKHVELTPAGHSFYLDVEDILARTNIAITKARNYSSEYTSRISVGYNSNEAVALLPQILSMYKECIPQAYIYMQIVEAHLGRIFLEDKKMDVLFTVEEGTKNLPDVGFEKLYDGYFSCVVPVGHPFEDKNIVTMSDIKSQSLIFLETQRCPAEMKRVQNYIQLHNPESVVYFSNSALTSYPMIKAGIGIAVMPDFVCPIDAELLKIRFETEDTISFGIAWNKKKMRKEIREFVAIAKELYSHEHKPLK